MAIELGAPVRVSPLIKASRTKGRSGKYLWCNSKSSEIWGRGWAVRWFSQISRDFPGYFHILIVIITLFSSAAGHSSVSASSTAPTIKAVWLNAKLESERSKNNRRPSATQNWPKRRSELLQVRSRWIFRLSYGFSPNFSVVCLQRKTLQSPPYKCWAPFTFRSSKEIIALSLMESATMSNLLWNKH